MYSAILLKGVSHTTATSSLFFLALTQLKMKLKYYCYITIHVSNSFKITTTPSLWFRYMALIHITLFLELDVIICYFHVHLNGIKYFLCIKKQRFWFILSIKFFTSKLVCQSRIFFSVPCILLTIEVVSLYFRETKRLWNSWEWWIQHGLTIDQQACIMKSYTVLWDSQQWPIDAYHAQVLRQHFGSLGCCDY